MSLDELIKTVERSLTDLVDSVTKSRKGAKRNKRLDLIRRRRAFIEKELRSKAKWRSFSKGLAWVMVICAATFSLGLLATAFFVIPMGFFLMVAMLLGWAVMNSKRRQSELLAEREELLETYEGRIIVAEQRLDHVRRSKFELRRQSAQFDQMLGHIQGTEVYDRRRESIEQYRQHHVGLEHRMDTLETRYLKLIEELNAASILMQYAELPIELNSSSAGLLGDLDDVERGVELEFDDLIDEIEAREEVEQLLR